jgi:hypothetical protein
VWACHPVVSIHPPSEDQVNVFALPDAEADPGVHLRAHRALSHRLPCRPLGCINESDCGRGGRDFIIAGNEQHGRRVHKVAQRFVSVGCIPVV